jgi:hypothetical protein
VAETLRQGLGQIIVIVTAGVKQISAVDGGWTGLMLKGGFSDVPELNSGTSG